MSTPIFGRESSSAFRASLSQLDFRLIDNQRLTQAVIFDKSPIDCGVVFAGKTSAFKQVALNVLAPAHVDLKIKGDDHFKAALFERGPQPTQREAETVFTGFIEPILVNERVSILDTVSGPGDIRANVGEFRILTDNSGRMAPVEIRTPQGRRVEYRLNVAPPRLSPLKAALTTPGAIAGPGPIKESNQPGPNVGGGNAQVGTIQTEKPNVFPSPTNPFYISVSFDAPNAIPQTYNATLIISVGGVSTEIPLSAKTGAIEVTSTGTASVMLGDVAVLPIRLSNLGGLPAKVVFASQQHNYGIAVASQVWTVPANQILNVSLSVQTSIAYFHEGIVLELEWRGSYGNNATGPQKLKAGLLAKIKQPEVTFSSTVYAMQGSPAQLPVTIVSRGPTTTFYFQAQGLPAGITMENTAVGVLAGATRTVELPLNVSKDSVITETGAGAMHFTVLYSAYEDRVKDTKGVSLFVDNAFKMQPQEQPQWCWAACTASAFDYYGGMVSQCTLADRFSKPGPEGSCCVTPAIGNFPHDVDDPLIFLGLLQELVKQPLGIDAVKSLVNANRPIIAYIKWSGGGAHVIAITGYVTTSSGNQMLIVEDPGGGSQTLIDIVTLTNQYGSAGTGSWTKSYLTKPPPAEVHVETHQ
jgi:hypothetical protein